MPPFFTPTTIVYKILFFLKRFLVAAADNVPPHKLSSLSYPPLPSTSVSKAGSLAAGPACEFVCFRVQVGGSPESAYLFSCKLERVRD